MSGQGDHPSGSPGWNPNWFGSQPFPSPETEYSAPPQTQSSGVPGGYRPYPIDDQDAPEGQYGWTPEPRARSTAPSQAPTPPTRGVRTPYTPAEMDALFKAYLEISEDPEVGTNQSGDHYWWRICRRYNQNRPRGTIERNESMVRNAIYRANEEIGKFNGYFLQEERSAGSGRNEVDIISSALTTYQSMNYKPFKYLNVWQETRTHPKYRGGVTSSSSGSSKRSRSVSLSDAGSEDVASQLAGANLGSPDAGPSGSQRRPQGRKKAAANRRRAATPSGDAPEPAPAPVPYAPPPPPNNSLWMLLGQLNMADRSTMTPIQLRSHEAMILGLQKQLGVVPPDE